MSNLSCILNRLSARTAYVIVATLTLGVNLLGVTANSSASDSRTTDVPIVFSITVPEDPEVSEVWISGNRAELGSWNGHGLEATNLGPSQFGITHSFPAGSIFEFKVTRGSWESVEKGPRGEEIANRHFQVAQAETIQVTVANWRDHGPTPEGSGRAATLSGDIRVHRQFQSDFVSARDILVCLPPTYDREEAIYPVLYMHDGQNLFDEATSFIGVEWGVDETLTDLVESGSIEPIIIVGIYNDGGRRIDEYTPVKADGKGGGAHSYGRFLTEELKPFIDKTYRTQPEREATGVAGSSLGGLVSLYLGLEFADTFSKIGAISPSIWWADRDIVTRVTESGRIPAERVEFRLWIDMGTAESESAITHARQLRDAFLNSGWQMGPEFSYLEARGASHNERAWADRIDDVLRFLYPPIR